MLTFNESYLNNDSAQMNCTVAVLLCEPYDQNQSKKSIEDTLVRDGKRIRPKRCSQMFPTSIEAPITPISDCRCLAQ